MIRSSPHVSRSEVSDYDMIMIGTYDHTIIEQPLSNSTITKDGRGSSHTKPDGNATIS